MKTVYTATINLEVSGDINRMAPEKIKIDHCDAEDNTFYPLAFTNREELDRYVSERLIREIMTLMKQYRDCKLTKLDFRKIGSSDKYICNAAMTHYDQDGELQFIDISVYEEAFKVKE